MERDKSKKLKIGYILGNKCFNLSKNEGCKIHVMKIMEGVRSAGHILTLTSIWKNKLVYDLRPDEIIYGSERGRKKSSLMDKLIWNRLSSKLIRSMNLRFLGLWENYLCHKECLQRFQGYDVLHERYGLYSFVGALVSRKLNIPLVLEVNAPIVEERDLRFLHGVNVGSLTKKQKTCARVISKFCFHNSAAIIAVSTILRNILINKYGVNPSKIVVLPNAVNVSDFSSADNDNLEIKWKKKMGIDKEKVIMYVGTLKPWHGLDILLESFSMALKKSSNTKLIFVGEGEMRPFLEKRIKSLKINNAVHLLGYVNHGDVPALLSIADIAVAPYPRFENLGFYFSPIKIFEYMASGKAIISSQIGQIAEVIQNGYSGVLVEPGNICALSEAILYLLKNEERRSFLGANARREAGKKHSWESYAKQLIKIYERIQR